MSRCLMVGILLLAPHAALGQDSGGPRVRLRFPDSLAIRERPEFGPGRRYGLRSVPALRVARWQNRVDRALAVARRRRLRDGVLARVQPATRPVVPAEPLLPPDPAIPVPDRGLTQYADLNLELNARVETRLDRLRNLNCTAFDVANPASGCEGGFPTPELGQQFELRASGVIADRLHVNVDFDGDREFSANNTINLWYEGREDDILRRVEVGNLDFQLPSSRFITSAIPANSFGLQADAQLGPLEFRSILAQQKGSSVRTRTYAVGDQTTQAIERTSRDLDFEVGRFFFVVDPEGFPSYPAIDVLNIAPGELAPTLRPVQVRVYRLRAQSGQLGDNPNLGGITATAIRPDSPQRVGPFPWELLVEGRDYFLDPSGAWFALANRVSNDEYLAVSYVTAVGDTVGTFPSVDALADQLLLIHEPRRGADVPTFRHEMRNAYRVGGRDIDRSSIDLTVSVNDAERPLDGVGTYLARLGLAQAVDPTRLDEFNRVFPRERDPNQGEPVRDLFVVFPHLLPFADSVLLQPGEINDSLYRTPTYLLSTEAPAQKFQLDWRYLGTGSGDRAQLSLGALQIREGSERLAIGGRELVRGRDYTIDYDFGVVRFSNPDSLFAGPSEVTVRFEENQLFDLAPKNVLGLATTYNLGSTGRIDLIGLFQRERSIFTRPRLGLEPQAMFMGGIAGDFEFRADWLTSALDGLPFLETSVPSILEVNGELALSRPNPNQAGEAYVEEFEGESARTIPLAEASFQLGSLPLSGRGIPSSYLGGDGEFDARDAVPLVWQNAIEVESGPLELGPQDIDSTIVLTGTARRIETLLWLSLKPDTIGGAPHPVTGAPRWYRPPTPGPRWRSITHSLDRSGLGVDLSRIEFLEFWVLEDFGRTAARQQAVLVFDFGTVLEDAVAFAPESLRVTGIDTTFTGFQFLGDGRLDSEKDPFTNVFNAAVHDVGIHGDLVPELVNAATLEPLADVALCERGFTVGIPVFPLGNLNARCTRANGLPDSEDLDGDNRLDVSVRPPSEDVVRHVVPVGDSPVVVKTGQTLTNVAGRTMTWRLYRVPFRQDTIEIGEPDLRRIRSVRMTLATPDLGAEQEEVFFAVARMRLVGAPWLKRADSPIAGFAGETGEPHGSVVASIVSTENQDLGYTSPPGVRDAAERQGAVFDLATQQINERSLRLIANDLREGERAEAFLRFADQSDKNFLKYRRLRVWARGRGLGWEEGELEFFIKVGQDADNFYLYRTRVRSEDWLPEVVIDLDRWLSLRGEIESDWLSGLPPSGSGTCGGDPLAYVRCDGAYVVQVRDPGVSPPNLARVSEVAVGIYRAAASLPVNDAELWVDDIRLSEVVDDVGLAGSFDARLTAADFAQLELGWERTDDRFRQLAEVPDYQGDQVTRVGGTVQLDRVLPGALGISMPVSVTHERTAVDPFYVRRTDIRASSLDNLREAGSRRTTYEVTVRRSRRGNSVLERMFVDPVMVTAAKADGRSSTELTSVRTADRRVRVSYDVRPGARTVRAMPGFLIGLIEEMPAWIRESEFGRALRNARLRWNPQQVRVISSWTKNRSRRSTFRVPVELAEDTSLVPLRSDVHTWRNVAAVGLRPFPSLGIRVDYASTRDLQGYGDSTSVGRLLQGRRQTLFGRDVGFERDRSLATSVTVSPALSSWLRPSAGFTSDFLFRRDPNARTPVRLGAGNTGGFRVPEALSNRRRTELGSTVDLARFAESAAGNTHLLAGVVRGILPADVRYTREKRSNFDRVPFDPSPRYQLALGNFEEFREQDGIPATSARALTEWVASGGSRLPFGLTLRVNYRAVEIDTRIRRGDAAAQIVQETTEWPSGVATWVYTPSGSLSRFLATVTARSQYRRLETSSFQPAVPGEREGEGVRTETSRETIRPSITLTWATGLATTAQYSRLRSDVVTSGNRTRTDESSWGGTVNFSVSSPAWLARLPSDVRTSLGWNQSDVFVCLQRVGGESCLPISDSRRQQLDVRVDTAFPPNLRGGASLSYVLNELRHVSSRFSQVIFTVFLDINFLASQIR